MKKICVLGSGAWGTAISCVLRENGHSVTVYGKNPDEVRDINENGRNSRYFDVNLPDGITATTDFDAAIAGAEVLVIAVPSFAVEEIVGKILPHLTETTLIVSLVKGFDEKSKRTVGEVIRDRLPYKFRKNAVSLLGPTFASEVAEKQFTAITASSTEYSSSKAAQKIFTTPYFRVYVNSDPVGAEYCSALKNVVAIACGIAEGSGGKINTRSALITRGLAEISAFVTELGGDARTCYGLAGVGDLTLTCSSETSRNYAAGIKIGKTSYAEFAADNEKTVEGLYACKIARELSKEYNIDAPVIDFVYEVTELGADAEKAFDKLKERIIGDE